MSLMSISSSPFRHSVGYSGYPCLLLYVRARDRFALTCSRGHNSGSYFRTPSFILTPVNVADTYASERMNALPAYVPRPGNITGIIVYSVFKVQPGLSGPFLRHERLFMEDMERYT